MAQLDNPSVALNVLEAVAELGLRLTGQRLCENVFYTLKVQKVDVKPVMSLILRLLYGSKMESHPWQSIL